MCSSQERQQRSAASQKPVDCRARTVRGLLFPLACCWVLQSAAAMASKYQKPLTIPEAYPAILKQFTREVLRAQVRRRRRAAVNAPERASLAVHAWPCTAAALCVTCTSLLSACCHALLPQTATACTHVSFMCSQATSMSLAPLTLQNSCDSSSSSQLGSRCRQQRMAAAGDDAREDTACLRPHEYGRA